MESQRRWQKGAEHMDANEARDALEQIAETKHEVAARSKAPVGYYAVIGFVQALFLTSFTLPLPWNFALLVPGLLVLGLAVAWYRNTAGTWAMGDVRGAGSWVFWVMVAVTVLGVVAALIFRTPLVGVIAGGAVFVTYAVLGPVWDRVYQRHVPS